MYQEIYPSHGEFPQLFVADDGVVDGLQLLVGIVVDDDAPLALAAGFDIHPSTQRFLELRLQRF